MWSVLNGRRKRRYNVIWFFNRKKKKRFKTDEISDAVRTPFLSRRDVFCVLLFCFFSTRITRFQFVFAFVLPGVPHGHTGHVRFLTLVGHLPQNISKLRRQSLNHQRKMSASGGKLLLISGGDGYEDFRSTAASEVAGREDSTNHLLLWHV